MYLIPIGWLYVVLMMSVAEATNTNGTVLGAVITFVLYGMLPVALVWYFMGTPGRKRKIRAQEMAEREAAIAAHAAAATSNTSSQPDAGSEAPADTIPPVGKEP